MTNVILIIGAGLFSKSVGSFEKNTFNHLSVLFLCFSVASVADAPNSIGGDTDGTKDGPGTFYVRGNVWHLDCCNPENRIDGNGWLIFGALTGWTNNATSKPLSTPSVAPTHLVSRSWHRGILCNLLVSRHCHAGSPQVARGSLASIRV